MSSLDCSRVVAIDGPAGSGKSTVAKVVAQETGLAYLDTGAMYRAITLGVLRRSIDPADRDGVAIAIAEIDLEMTPGVVKVDGVDATELIRGSEVTTHVSAVAANPAVRAALVGLQQAWIMRNGGGVLEGRDIGTVVAPGAGVKVYLTASTRERARRRAAETGADIDEVEADLARRDAADSEREQSPLRAADDAINIDTTEHRIPEVVARIVELVTDAGIIG